MGCVVVGSDTGPVKEVIEDDVNGLLTPFFDGAQLAKQVVRVLANPRKHARLGRAARAHVVQNYDFESQTLPNYMQIIRAAEVPA